MFYIAYGCSSIEGTSAFRIPWGVQMLPAVILFFGLFFLPESPRWLAGKSRWEQAHAVLALVHGHGDDHNPAVEIEMKQIKDACEFEAANNNVSWFELFSPSMINRTHIGVFTQIWSQLTG
jgi:hypothetical protein